MRQFEIMEARGGSFPGGYDAFRQFCANPSNRKELAKHFPSDHLGTMRRLARENLTQISEQFGVLCLSTVGDSLAMWSHYADKHRGIVVGFDLDHPHFAKLNWFKVDYSRDRVGVDIGWTLKKANAAEARALEIFKTKSKIWCYEEEIRSIFRLSELESSNVSNGKKDHFWKVPKETIKEVKLGYRCPKTTEDSVRVAISANDLRDVNLERAGLDDTRFALLFRPA